MTEPDPLLQKKNIVFETIKSIFIGAALGLGAAVGCEIINTSVRAGKPALPKSITVKELVTDTVMGAVINSVFGFTSALKHNRDISKISRLLQEAEAGAKPENDKSR